MMYKRAFLTLAYMRIQFADLAVIQIGAVKFWPGADIERDETLIPE
jgi:hypothetical protein